MCSDAHDLDRFAEVASWVADAAGDVIRKYFRKKFEIIDKPDFSMWVVFFFLFFFLVVHWSLFMLEDSFLIYL